MTIRRWMIVVVAVALAFGGLAWLGRMEHQRQIFLALARGHEQQRVVNRLILEGLAAHGAATVDTEKYRMRDEYHRALNLKYAHAARYPWRPVAPDPPEPK